MARFIKGGHNRNKIRYVDDIVLMAGTERRLQKQDRKEK